jgi:hypothetical protein
MDYTYSTGSTWCWSDAHTGCNCGRLFCCSWCWRCPRLYWWLSADATAAFVAAVGSVWPVELVLLLLLMPVLLLRLLVVMRI